MTDKRIEYSEEAGRELALAQAKIRALLEKLIAEEKFIPGNEIIEITGADIRNALSNIVILPNYKYTRRRMFLWMSLIIYLLVGIFSILMSFLYPAVLFLKDTDPVRFAFLAGGAFITLIAGAMLFFLRAKDVAIRSAYAEQKRELERLVRQSRDDLEQMLRPHFKGRD